MKYIIATYRPFHLLKPISWVNAITRQKQRAPYDHVCSLIDGVIYESVVGKGVRKIPFEEWKKGREGTTLFMFEMSYLSFNMSEFNKLEGRKYDIPSNIFNLFGLFKLLSRKADKKIQCAELIAHMRNFEYPERYTPRKIVDTCRNEGRKLKIEII